MRRVALAALGCALLAGCGDDPAVVAVAPQAAPCDLRATPATLQARLDEAAPRGVVCLAAGDYGTFRGEGARGLTLRGAERRSRLRIELEDFEGPVLLEGMTIRFARLVGETRHVTIRDSAFTGAVSIDGLVDADVLLDRNTHLDIDAPGDTAPARIHLGYSADRPSGVTVRDSLLAGGDADGIQSGVGLAIVGNEFRDILQKGPNHTDAIQLMGAPGSLVRGNRIHASATGIVAYDGLERAVIEDNEIDLPGRPWGIEIAADDGSVVRRNTLRFGACDYDQPCGQIALSGGGGAPTVVEANVATAIAVSDGAAVERRGNVVREGAVAGETTGAP